MVAVLVLGSASVLPKRGELYGVMHPDPGEKFETFFAEGRDGVIVTRKRGRKVSNFINGLGHGGRPGVLFAAEAVQALSLSPRVEDVLIIGFGTGTVTEMALLAEGVRRVTLVELNETLIENLEKMEVFRRILSDRRIHLVLDDGRRFLLRDEEEYDVVMMDPLRTTTSYSNNIYSLEFFELVSRHLAPGGVFLIWTDDALAVPRTAAHAFERVLLFELGGQSYFCVASDGVLREDRGRREGIIAGIGPAMRPAVAEEVRGLRPVLDRAAIVGRSAGVPINRDWRPVSEYYLGLQRITGAVGGAVPRSRVGLPPPPMG